MNIEQVMYEIIARSSARCVCGPEGYDNEELISTFINFDKVFFFFLLSIGQLLIAYLLKRMPPT